MIRTKCEFLIQLNELLPKQVDKAEILAEYENFIFEIENETMIANEDELIELVMKQIGTPEQLANNWKSEPVYHPNRAMIGFFLVNLIIFLAGSLLTVCYHTLEIVWIQQTWNVLIGVPVTLLLLYSIFFWLLGFEVGKEFGHRGRVMAPRIFLLTIIPNIILMIGTVFQLYPFEWFQPLLNGSFIVDCVLFTLLLFPINCWIGYRIGKRLSV
ncbi:hypothetical protein ACIQD3_06430 [Peribacillus loiseleuriae]|uniref:hypothetical protein n=1 Tax=Peribacillus loiseleuriae TaxID=1679170 RepID=UPI00382DF7A0